MEQILNLDPNDDITSIRSRIDFVLPTLTRQAVQQTGSAKRPRLLLLVPRKNAALKSLVNMKLLARTVQSRAVDVAIVSGNPTIRDYAKEAGLKVFGSQGSARRAGWISKTTPVAAPDDSLPPVVPEPVAEPLAPKKEKSTRRRVKPKKYVVVEGDKQPGRLKYLAQQAGMLILIVVLAFALVVGFIGLLPRASVTITPVAQPVHTELTVKADPNVDSVDFANLTFPARKAQVELSMSGEIETVETELTPVEKATGQVVFINRTEDEQTIPISTTVATSAGTPVEFITVQTATIPAGTNATTTTQVIAVQPGPRGNVSAGQINRFAEPGFGLLARVVNESATSGGALAPAKIITEDDKPRLDAYLQQIIQEEGLRQIEASLGEQEFVPPESVEVIVLDKKYRDFSGDFSDTFGGQMQAVVRATVIGGYNANRLALAALEAQVPPGYELNIEGLQFGAGEIYDITDGVVTFRIFASGQAEPVLDGRQIAERVAWLPVGQAQQLLSEQYQLATVPGIEVQPDWLAERLGRLPFSPLRISVTINKPVTVTANEG
ncbi:MAG: hypothetical protein D6768_01870 [Chloroflexi bacterium]|nr:MAG: hypothetical protein D6768_01870 [Chloroflexota bacterium]